MNYTPSTHWDEVFQRFQASGSDLDWADQWTGSFIEILRSASISTVLDLGCGTGNDVIRLQTAGFQAMGLDYSAEAIRQASQKAKPTTSFVVADIAKPLPFASEKLDAVMSNVALHMFSDQVTRAVFREIWRIIRPDGLFLFHVNALEDRPLRMKWQPVVEEIEPNYVLEQHGQTMHFFSDAYLRELLADWSTINLEFVEIPHRESQEPFKRVWRGIVRK